jgi:hypothetical protein
MDRDPRRLERDFDARQRNLVFPDTVRNGRSVDAFLWRGVKHPTPVQRIGAFLFGAVYLITGITIISLAMKERSIGAWLFGAGFALLGAKVFSNGLAK